MINSCKKHFIIGSDILENYIGDKIFQYSKHFELLNSFESIKNVSKEILITTDLPNKYIPTIIDKPLTEIHKMVESSCNNGQELSLGCYWTKLDIEEFYNIYSAFIIGTENTSKFVIRETETLYTKLRDSILNEFPQHGKLLHKSIFDAFHTENLVKRKYKKFFTGFVFELKISNKKGITEHFSETVRAIMYADIRYHFVNEFIEIGLMDFKSINYTESNLHSIYNDNDMTNYEDIENVWHLENRLIKEEE